MLHPPETTTERPPLKAKIPFAQAERASILEQAERILESPLFKQSKRYSLVFRYLVNHALEGSQNGSLKERTIGVEVLGRNPDYDTNADPTVRVVASEIRKRLVLYYLEPGHASRVRIDLPSGSYTPEFTAQPEVESPAPIKSRSRRVLFWAVGATLTAALLLFVGLRLVPPETALDRFWAPVLHGSPTVLVCIGESRDDRLAQVAVSASTSSAKDGSANDSLRFLTTQSRVPHWDVIALTGVTDFLQSRSIRHPIRDASSASLVDLRQGPAILVGSYSNYWSMRLGENLRYRFMTSKAGDLNWIEDAQNPARRDWQMSLTLPYTDVTTYGVITRVVDSSTGRIVVSVGGVTGIGTAAASEFLVNRAGWEAVAKQAPKDWEHKSLQVVIASKVINGNYGPPSVIATYFW